MSKYRRNILYIDSTIENSSRMLEQLSCDEFLSYCTCTRESAVEILSEKQIDVLIISSDFETGVVPSFASEVCSDYLGTNVILLTKRNQVVPKNRELESCFCGIVQENGDSKRLITSLVDILESTTKRDEYLKLKTLLPLCELSESFQNARNEKDVFDGLISILSNAFSVPNISIMLLDSSANKLKIVASKGMSPKIAKGISITPGQDVAGWVFSEGKPIILNKRTQHSTPVSNFLIREDINAAISFPLVGKEKVIGVLNINHNEKDVFYSQSEIDQLTIICRQAVAAL